MEKKGITGKIETWSLIELILIGLAFMLNVIGLVRNSDICRAVIYAGQGFACALIFVYGVFDWKYRNREILRTVLYYYAILEAVRTALLNTTGIHPAVAAIARLILALLACNYLLVAERMDRKPDRKLAAGMVILETALYIVFIAGFPGVMLGRLNRFLPLAGIFIAGCTALLQTDPSEQTSEKSPDQEKKA